MREIKFRAWDTETKSWWLVNYSLEQIIHTDIATENFIWCQSTGLHDRNGRLIYEGDIVKPTLKSDIEKTVLQVVFSRAYFSVTDSDQFEHEPLFIHARTCEVIGNIHDNPELVKNV